MVLNRKKSRKIYFLVGFKYYFYLYGCEHAYIGFHFVKSDLSYKLTIYNTDRC